MSVALRPLVSDDAAWLDSWLPAVAHRVGYDDVDDARAILDHTRHDSRFRARVVVRAGDPIGIALYELASPREHAARFELLALEPPATRKGRGLLAAAMIEQEMAEEGARRAYAPAPAIHGIDVYFWIRLGYRPLLRGDWPCVRPGVAWLGRDIG